jgi:hypothetical protein
MSLSSSVSSVRMRIFAAALSLIVAIMYFVIAFGWVPDGFESPPVPVMFLAGLAYLIGGVLIMQVGERFLRLGLLLNLLVLIIFAVSALSGRSTVDELTILGKVAQVGLAVALFWLVAKTKALAR